MTESEHDGGGDPGLTSRRSVLLGAGALGAAGLLAGCGTDEPAVTPSTQPPVTPAARATTPAPSASASGAVAAGPDAIRAADIPVGGGKIYEDRRVVVTQPTAGTFKAFDSTCTHQGCLLTSVSDGKINCMCHMSQFNVADGSVARGPATRSLTARTATVSGTMINVS